MNVTLNKLFKIYLFFLSLYLFICLFHVDSDGVLGTVPQAVIASQQDFVRNATESNFNLVKTFIFSINVLHLPPSSAHTFHNNCGFYSFWVYTYG